jgi:NAD(P)-dependent dehydrogenase (short-subunit alcohol dehydrogenase family)
MDINQKIILISGGASGMGAASVARLKQKGAKVAVIDLKKNSLADLSLEVNVSNSDSINEAINQIVKQFGAIHVTINCAGIAPAARIVSKNGPMPLSDFQRVIEINLLGTFNVMRLAAAQMMQQDPVDENGERGIIINTASIAAFEGQIGQSAYSASKGGIVALTLPAAREFGPFGIRVMTIAPGVIATPLMSQIPIETATHLANATPFPKRLGYPEEFAQLVEHIIENSYLNGSVIRLDGALRMSPK